MEKRNKSKKVILGIDPGSTKIGYGVISCKDKEPVPEVIGYGYIDLRNHKPQSARLLQLHEDLRELITQYKPESVAVENLYFFKNVKTFTPVTQAKGVILFTAAQAKLNVFEYTPLEVKQTITGYGKADKDFIQKFVRSSLNISSSIRPDDASDALAIALCHLRHLTKL